MSPEEERSEDLKALEAALAALAPRVEGFDRERLIFEAGRASAMAEIQALPAPQAHGLQPVGFQAAETRRPGPARGRWAWPTAFSAMTALAATLLVMLVSRPEPQVADPVQAPSSAAQTASQPAIPRSQTPATTLAYIDRPLRDRMMMHGIDLWAEPAVPQSSGLEMARAPSSVLQLQQELMKESAPGGRAQPRLAPPRFSPFGERS